jgi:nucleoside-diphosphate-sugar epimerase
MKIFITGASGFVGSNIVRLLVADGHSVTGLARSDASADKIASLGATPVRGTHTDLDVLRNAASEADATIHCAFNHDDAFSKPTGFIQACDEDRAAIAVICDVLCDTGKTFINTSGTMGNLGPDETSAKHIGPEMPRGLSENLTLSYAKRGVRALVIRLAPIVHGQGKEHPFIATQIAVAKESGFAGNVGETKWPAVHVEDAARLFVLALDEGKAPSGSSLHAVGEEGVLTRDIAEFIGRKLGVETRKVEAADAMAHWGFVGQILCLGSPATAVLTRQWTGWAPKEQGLFSAIEGYAY